MCWADKIGLVGALLFGAFLYVVHQMPGVGLYTYFVLEMIFVFPIWLGLRLIDLVLGGPARRAGAVMRQPR